VLCETKERDRWQRAAPIAPQVSRGFEEGRRAAQPSGLLLWQAAGKTGLEISGAPRAYAAADKNGQAGCANSAGRHSCDEGKSVRR
jgi:hypothetical protein